jgi:hypothetical protein
MRTGMKFAKFAGMIFLCVGCLSALSGASAHTQRKTKKPPLAPLPNGPTGPVPQIPLDSIASVPPQVTYQNGLLTIVAANSTLSDILRAVKKQTGADIEVPSANDRVVTHLGPGSAREVMADLLNGSRFNYVLLGSAQDTNLLTRVVLVAKTGTEGASPVNAQIQQQQPGPMQAGNIQPQPPPEEQAEAAEGAEVAEDNPDDNPDQQAADAEQQQAEQANPAPDQQGVKTPQQMLQEMQQRQLQMQQQQQQGQVPGIPVPNRPPQEQ